MSITIEQVSKRYQHKLALKEVSLTFQPQTIYGLLGRNGAGKSTLLNIINNRIYATEGCVCLSGEPITDNEAALNRIYLMSEFSLYPDHLELEEIFKWTEKFYGGFDWKLTNRMMQLFALDQTSSLKKMSTGYRSIAKLIIALAVPAEYVFLDEPVLGLDANHRELFYQFLLETYQQRPRTFVISTHLIEEIAYLIEEVVILDKGEVIRCASVEELLGERQIIAGPANLVNDYVKDMVILAREQLGSLVSVSVQAPVNHQPIPEGITVSPLSLQAYFVQLTQTERRESYEI